MKRFYGKNDELDPTDKFLRNYILMEGWKDKDVDVDMPKGHNLKAMVDDEDEARDDEMD